MRNERINAAFCGGAYGDEGKGRIVDEYVNNYLMLGKNVIVYRDNGGANAGHTLELADGQRIALHLLPSGVLNPNATVILGKGMVIHPGDLNTEINEVKQVNRSKKIATIMVDEMAVLSLDTHRAFEAALKNWQEGSRGATGRGIGPAYADILLRHPLRMRDLVDFDEKKIRSHYKLYQALLDGLGVDIKKEKVPAYGLLQPIEVGSEDEFVQKLLVETKSIRLYIKDVYKYISQTWPDNKYAYVFEKAQAIGLDPRWGVYPDVTASDTTFEGFFSATDGLIDPNQIKIRAAVIKATYMSSVGTRILPTIMENNLAAKIREDAKEYGATTKRSRDIAYIDLPALRFFSEVGRTNCHVLTHMDVAYPNIPITVCTRYEIDGESVKYRPDQEHLLKVNAVYEQLPSWDRQEIQKARYYKEIPKNARAFLDFMADSLSTEIMMITTGPRRDQSIKITDK